MIKIYDKLIENLKGEDCEQNINIIRDITDIKQIFNIVIIFHLTSLEYLNNITKNYYLP